MATNQVVKLNRSGDPLSLRNWNGMFDEADIVAYDSCVDWNHQTPEAGAQFEITVTSPFCCVVGDTFWAVYRDSEADEEAPDAAQFVQARLISVLSAEERSAKIVIEVLQVRDSLSFLKPVPEALKQLFQRHEYIECGSLVGPDTDLLGPKVSIEGSWTIISHSMGGGDLRDCSSVYTDPNGIDHLVTVYYYDCMADYTFVGDRILGLHADNPYRWENGLLIYGDDGVLDCAEDATEVVIPEGIVYIMYHAFANCPFLKSITIPDSVRLTESRLSFYPKKPKEILLSNTAGLKNWHFPSDVKITRVDGKTVVKF